MSVTLSDWEHCARFEDAVGEGIGTYDDPDEWRGVRKTPDAPCGHRFHNYDDTADEDVLFLGQTTPQRSSYGLVILLALQRKPMYEGTVSSAEIAKRRARGKRAKAARKVHR